MLLLFTLFWAGYFTAWATDLHPLSLAKAFGQSEESVMDELLTTGSGQNEESVMDELLTTGSGQNEESVMDELDSVERLLNDTRMRASAAGAELDNLGMEIEETQRRRRLLEENIVQSRYYVTKRMDALFRMKLMNRKRGPAMPESLLRWMLRSNAVKVMVKEDMELIGTMERRYRELESVESDLRVKMAEQKELAAQLSAQRSMIDARRREKENLLQRIREDKDAEASASKALKLAALELEREMMSREMMSDTPGDSEGGTLLFADMPGLLDIPVKGTIISKFGTEKNSSYGDFTFQRGIDIRVQRGAPVKSVFRGEVVYSRWLRGYGNLIIIDHGYGYHTLYAHLEERFKQKGDKVATGEVIAAAGDSASMKGLCLHFEIRQHGSPLDPMQWLRSSS
ncbi:MAG: peptidoglycan DD-metalloendopeptidase family protein [Desulfamplus sp.]|nr:peptidoglycan DD-metalloendopeptidase family protein [Desulfamplus sp.]